MLAYFHVEALFKLLLQYPEAFERSEVPCCLWGLLEIRNFALGERPTVFIEGSAGDPKRLREDGRLAGPARSPLQAR